MAYLVPEAGQLSTTAVTDIYAHLVDSTRCLIKAGHAGRSLTAPHLNHRLKALGIRRGGSNTALRELASELPSVIVSRLLGLHKETADIRQREGAGFGPEYAAGLSLREAQEQRLSNRAPT
ncbi:hypothetical protein ACWC0C_47540 [Streptomyces sp. NPDC001709]